MNNKASYPAQAVYPQQTNAPLYPPAMQASPQAPPYTDAPPSYSEIYQPRFYHPQAAQGQLHQMSSAYPQMYLPLQQSLAMGPMGHGIPMAYYPMGGLYPPGSTILVDGGYDSAARYAAGSGSNIPAPAPGQLPSAAQLAAMQQSANMMMAQQRKGGYFIGGSGGGYTIW